MKVFLTGEEGAFKITRLSSSDEQIIEGKSFAQWEWEVTPQKWGTHKLYLTATVNLLVPGRGEKPVDVPVFIKPIEIKVNYSYLAISFLSVPSNWTYIIGGGSLVAFLGGIGGWIKKRRSKKGTLI